MRTRKMAVLAFVVVAGAGLVAVPEAAATGSSGTCNSAPTFTVASDRYGVLTPCRVTQDPQDGWRCAGPNEASSFTGIKYKNATSTHFNHVATLVTRNNQVVQPSGSQVITGCKGDPVTELGKRSCNVSALKINGVPASGEFWVVVAGRSLPIETTIATKAGSTIKCFAIAGLGVSASSDELVQQVQRVTSQDGCAVDFVVDTLTGAPVSAKLTPESVAAGCESPTIATDGATINAADVSTVEVKLGGQSLGAGKFGDGYLRSGTNSCTTRIIGGRVYTWGNPCPEP